MEYVIISILVIVLILLFIIIFKRNNNSDIIDKVSKTEVSLIKEINDFRNSFSHEFNHFTL